MRARAKPFTETERKRTQNSEFFIVEGHLTHYKRYDYKHAHTTYTKQLTNNTKQTDKTKRNRKKETNTYKKEEEKKHPPPLPQHPRPPHKINEKKEKEKGTKYPRCRQHTSDTCKSKYCHIWDTHYWGILTPPSLLLNRHQNKGENTQWR